MIVFYIKLTPRSQELLNQPMPEAIYDKINKIVDEFNAGGKIVEEVANYLLSNFERTANALFYLDKYDDPLIAEIFYNIKTKVEGYQSLCIRLLIKEVFKFATIILQKRLNKINEVFIDYFHN